MTVVLSSPLYEIVCTSAELVVDYNLTNFERKPMNTQQLKSLLKELYLEEPEFFVDLVGEIVRDNLGIHEQRRGNYDDWEKPVNPELRWGSNCQVAEAFSWA